MDTEPAAARGATDDGVAFKRHFGLVSNFSLGFTYLSPLTGIYSLFAYALVLAGPPAIWWILLVAAGQMLVALVFGEVASQFPLTGGLYPWARRLWGRRYAWLAGWIYLWAMVVTVTSVAEYGATFVADLFGYPSGNLNQFIGAVGMLGLAFVFNLSGTRVLARVAQLGFWAEMLGVIGLGMYLLLFARVHSFAILFDPMGIAGADGAYLPAFIDAALLGLWLFYGFEACGNVAEEVRDPGRKIPLAMIFTIVFGAISAVLSFAGYLLAVPDLGAVLRGAVKDPIASVLEASLGHWGAKLFLVVALTAFLSCALSLQAALSRLLYAFARDDMLPASSWLKTMDRRHAVPNNAMRIACVLPIVVCGIVYLLPGSLPRITAFAVTGIYVSFGMVTFAAIRQRFSGWQPAGAWSLGAGGWAVNVAALLFQAFALYVLVRPDSLGAGFVDRWIVLLGFGTVLGAGLLYMWAAKPYGRSSAPQGDAIANARALREGDAAATDLG